VSADEQALDELLTSALRTAQDAGQPMSRRQLVRLVRETHQCRLSEAHEAVKDYCARHDLTLTDPPTKPWEIALGCVAGLLLLLLPFVLVAGILLGGPHYRAPAGADPATLALAKYGWSALLTFALVNSLWHGNLYRSLDVLRQMRPGLLAQNLLVLIVTVACALGLVRLFPWLNRSWLYLLPGWGSQAVNLNVLPATIKYFGPFFLVLLALNLPTLARSEELKYRQGTRDWRDALGRSVRFGLVHCVVGVPLYAGLALTVSGLWFTLQYFRGGVDRSTLHHVAYNLTVTLVVFPVLLLQMASG